MTNRNHRRARALAIALVATPALALAGDEEAGSSTSQADELDDLKARIEALEAQESAPVSELPEWLKKWTFKGDFRYRWERFDVEGQETRNRHRLRARINIGVDINDYTTFGAAIATGAEDPVSTNATLGQGWESLEFNFDEAFVNYHPWQAEKNGFNGAFIGGKMRVPFLQVTKSELVWDSDLRPEGISTKFDGDIGNTNLFFNGGAYYLRENKNGTDTGMGGAQLGLSVPISSSKLTFGGSYYDYIAIQGRDVFDWEYNNGHKNTANARGNSATAPGTDGDRQYLEDFDLVEGFINYDFKVSDMPLAVFGSYVENVAASDYNTGYDVGFKVNKAKKKGTWEVRLQWKKLEKDAIVGAFADSDFGGGGTDADGGELNLAYAFDDDWKVLFSWFHNQIDISSTAKDYDRFQLDFIWKF